jgi:hypothetical protein
MSVLGTSIFLWSFPEVSLYTLCPIGDTDTAHPARPTNSRGPWLAQPEAGEESIPTRKSPADGGTLPGWPTALFHSVRRQACLLWLPTPCGHCCHLLLHVIVFPLTLIRTQHHLLLAPQPQCPITICSVFLFPCPTILRHLMTWCYHLKLSFSGGNH